MAFNPELKIYYQRIFPVDMFCKWLSYKQADNDNDSRLSFREFSITLQDDVYIRYNSFENQNNLYELLTNKVPVKFDIGAEYNIQPAKIKSHAMKALQKELIFDIDITDYDNVRNCCKETDICDKCWYFIVVACKILQSSLQEDFGFKHILWVFSGRRGIHCWVCDKEARYLSEEIRKEIVNYFYLIAPNGYILNAKQQVFLKRELPIPIRRAVAIIDKYFVEHCVISQNILGTTSNINKFFTFIEDKNFCDELIKKFETVQLSIDRWVLFLKFYEQYTLSENYTESLNHLIEKIKLYYMYLRLDVNVTKSSKHLLKAPFCVHQKTQKICIPINPNKIEKFQINEVPTLNSVLEEIDKFQGITYGSCDILNADTSLKEPLSIFCNFISHLQKTELQTSEMLF